MSSTPSSLPEPRLPSSARYRIASCIASGGMGSVYVGIQRGAAGFKRPVAIKRAHPHLLDDPDMRSAIMSEARNASVVRHPNVVSVDDVEETDGELLLVMDYVEGTSLSHVLATRGALPPDVVVRIILDACAGLNAIHIAKNEDGEPLGLVHRDVSPQNILIDTDGIARVTDFGIAKAACAPVSIRNGSQGADPPGKLGYMAPEYLKGSRFSPQSDIFALGVVLWESLTGKNLFRGASSVESLRLTLDGHVPLVRSIVSSLPATLDDVLARCLAIDPDYRFDNVRDLADALEDILRPAGRDQVASVVVSVASVTIAEHRKAINHARISGRPPRDVPSFDVEEGLVPVERLAMPDMLTIDVTAPPEPQIFVSSPDTSKKPPRSSRAGELLSAAAQKPRTKGMIALGLALVTFVVSTTALIVALGTGEEPIPPRAPSAVNVTSGQVQ